MIPGVVLSDYSPVVARLLWVEALCLDPVWEVWWAMWRVAWRGCWILVGQDLSFHKSFLRLLNICKVTVHKIGHFLMLIKFQTCKIAKCRHTWGAPFPVSLNKLFRPANQLPPHIVEQQVQNSLMPTAVWRYRRQAVILLTRICTVPLWLIIPALRKIQGFN